MFRVGIGITPELKGSNWTKEFADFLSHCLQTDPFKVKIDLFMSKKLKKLPFLIFSNSNFPLFLQRTPAEKLLDHTFLSPERCAPEGERREWEREGVRGRTAD